MDLAHLRKAIRGKPTRRSDESGPQPPVDKRDLTVDQATHEDLVAVADRSRHREDLATLRMRPPATADRLSRNDLGKRRYGPSSGLEYHPVLTNESEGLA
jgi:hypothetical protein